MIKHRVLVLAPGKEWKEGDAALRLLYLGCTELFPKEL